MDDFNVDDRSDDGEDDGVVGNDTSAHDNAEDDDADAVAAIAVKKPEFSVKEVGQGR